MTRYDIPLRVKLSNKEYDIIKSSPNKSKMVRDAINAYYGDHTRDIETSKKELLDELRDEIKTNEDNFKEKLLKEHFIAEKNLLSGIESKYKECEINLNIIDKETENVQKIKKENTENELEEKVKTIIPTLQGIYYSNTGLTHDKLSRMAQRIGVNTFDLKEWTENNLELIMKTDYEDRPTCKNKTKGKIYINYEKEF